VLLGTAAPDFTLPDQDGESVSLAGTLAHSRVVLIFYVLDHTLG